MIIPETLECAELRNIKYLEVRGFVGGSNEVELKEYCDFKDNFGKRPLRQTSRPTTRCSSCRRTVPSGRYSDCVSDHPSMLPIPH